MNRQTFLKKAGLVSVGAVFVPAGFARASREVTPTEAVASAFGFEQAIRGRESAYPVLARSVYEGIIPAHSTKIEWLVGRRVLTNHTQIVRTPFRNGGDTVALERHLGEVERILRYGKPGSWEYSGPVAGSAWPGTPHRPGTCGGCSVFLGYDYPKRDDLIRLRPLRDLRLLKDRQPVGANTRLHEWISEFSLQVVKGGA